MILLRQNREKQTQRLLEQEEKVQRLVAEEKKLNPNSLPPPKIINGPPLTTTVPASYTLPL